MKLIMTAARIPYTPMHLIRTPAVVRRVTLTKGRHRTAQVALTSLIAQYELIASVKMAPSVTIKSAARPKSGATTASPVVNHLLKMTRARMASMAIDANVS